MAEPTAIVTSEPPLRRSVRWRVAIYPFALAVGALSASIRRNLPLKLLSFFVFAALMLAPLALKLRAWGGIGRAWRWFFRKRLAVTRGGFIFLSITVLFGVAAINTGTNLLYLIMAMLLSLIVVSGILSELAVTGLRISRRVPPYVFAHEDFRVRVAVSNPRKLTPALVLEVREASGPFGPGGAPAEGPPVFLFRLDPGERRSLVYVARAPRRGVYPLSGFVLASQFPFGFFTKFKRAELPAELVVYPRPRELSPNAVRALARADEAPRPKPFYHSPDEFRSTREYRAGDNPRWIHWRSSARQRRLVVKEFEPRAARTSAVVLDTDPGERAGHALDALDRGTTLAASLIEHLLQRDERPELALVAQGEVARFGAQVPGAGRRGAGFVSRGGLAACLEALARAKPSFDPEFAKLAEAASGPLSRGARVIVLTARDAGLARRAVEAAAGGVADALDVLSFASDEAVAPLYAPLAADGDGNGAGRAPSMEAD